MHNQTSYAIDGCYCATTAPLPNDVDSKLPFLGNPNPGCALPADYLDGQLHEPACWGELRCDYNNPDLGDEVMCKTQKLCRVKKLKRKLFLCF